MCGASSIRSSTRCLGSRGPSYQTHPGDPARGGRAGQRVCVIGTIGDAALGPLLPRDAGVAESWKIRSADENHLVVFYLLPQLRNSAAEAFRVRAAGAMDVSDALAGDLAKLCRGPAFPPRLSWAYPIFASGSRLLRSGSHRERAD